MISSIQDLIDKSLLPKPRIRSGKWNPSSFGYCFRSQYWNRKDEPKSNPPDARSMRVFKVGDLFHEFVQNTVIRFEPCIIETEIETDDVKSFVDIVRETEVVDLKSQHSKSFWWMLKKDCDIKVEKYGNWLQVMYGAKMFGKDFGRLVFISKDDLAIQEYVQPLKGYWLKQVTEELRVLRLMWDNDHLPKAKPRCNHSYNKKTKECKYWHCTYCSWQDKCRDMEGASWPAIIAKELLETK